MRPKNLLFRADEDVVRSELFSRLRREVGDSYGKKLQSLVGRALDAAGYSPNSPADLRLALCHLEQRSSTKAIGADAPAACRKVRALVLGGAGKKRVATAEGVVLLPATWRGLLAYAPTKYGVRYENRLVRLARAVEFLGGLAGAPARMPSIDEMMEVAQEVGLSANSIDGAVTIYRELRRAAVEADPANAARFALLPDRRRTQGRQILAVLAERGEQCDLEDPMMGIERLAPMFFRQLRKYEANPVMGERIHNPRTVAALLSCGARLVGALSIYAPEVLPTFTIKELWNQTRSLSEIAGDREEWDDDLPVSVEVPLARWLIAHVAPEVRARCAPDAASGYNSVILADLSHWFSLTEWAHGMKMRERDPLRWDAWRQRYRNLRHHVTENRIPKELLVRTKDKEAIISLFTMPHVWCVALPVLMRESERFLDQFEAEITAALKARPNSDPLHVLAVQDALDRFAVQAEGALHVALVFFDGMRSAQYRGGRWGEHIRPDVDHETGEWLGIQTRWVGYRLDSARVKQGKARARRLGAAHLSFRVLQAYLRYVRAPRLIAKGVDAATACDADGRFPLFVSPLGATPVPYSADHLRLAVFGPVVYRIATEFFGSQVGASTDYEDVDREKLYGVLGIHMARYINATGCYRILEDHALAEELTSDDSEVLEKSYVCHTWLPEGREGTWHNALSYRPWLKQMVLPGAMENPLDTMPRDLLPPGVLTLMAHWEEEDRALKRRLRTSTYGSPSGRQRRARPDVADRNRRRAEERRSELDSEKEVAA